MYGRQAQEHYYHVVTVVDTDYSFDDINTLPFTTLLSAQIAEW